MSEETDSEREQLRIATEALDRFLPWSELIPIHEAFELVQKIAAELKVPAYKTESRLRSELLKRNLITTRQRPKGTTVEEWMRSPEPGLPNVEYTEYTSEEAIRELFRRKAARRKELDRDRKREKRKPKKARQTKTSQNRRRTA